MAIDRERILADGRLIIAEFGDRPPEIPVRLIYNNLFIGGLDRELSSLDNDRFRIAFTPSSALFDIGKTHWRGYVAEDRRSPVNTLTEFYNPILTVVKNKFLEVISTNGHITTRYASLDGTIAGRIEGEVPSPDFYDQFRVKSGLIQPDYISDNPLPNPLTDVESGVLQEIVCGGTDKDVAERLERSVNTVRTHVRNIFHKLQALDPKLNNKTAVAIAALRNGWVKMPEEPSE